MTNYHELFLLLRCGDKKRSCNIGILIITAEEVQTVYNFP